MHTIRKIVVEGFWGTRTVEVDFDKNVNFLIGKNGCGKTTLINILASAVRLDLDAIDRQVFKKIRLELQDATSRSIAELHIERPQPDPTLPAPLTVKFRPKKSDEWIEQDLSEFMEFRRRMRQVPASRVRDLENVSLAKRLHEIVNLTWLSIHRSTLGRRFEGPEGIESTVDAKVKEITTNLGSFLSSLDTNAARETTTFQEQVFLSLLFNPSTDYSPFSRKIDVDVAQEKMVLTNIFEQFGLAEKTFRGKLDRHFDAVSKALKNRDDREKHGLSLEDFVALADTQRIRTIVREWQETQARTQNIYQPKDSFLNIINKLFVRKELGIDERNRPYILTADKKRFGPEALSSGEKQLFILLGEVLLHEKQPYVFIADEPELSLHVEWQSNLVKNLTSLNPNMQIIFATHSPDIVSVYQQNVIRMEEKVA